MMHIWGRLSRVVMACALSVLFLGGYRKNDFGCSGDFLYRYCWARGPAG